MKIQHICIAANCLYNDAHSLGKQLSNDNVNVAKVGAMIYPLLYKGNNTTSKIRGQKGEDGGEEN